MKKKLVTAFLGIFLTGLCFTASAQLTEKEWQAKAVEKYPALGVQGSEFNKRFLDEFREKKKANPHFFDDPRWPLSIADELQKAAAVESERHAPVPAQSPPALPDAKPETEKVPQVTNDAETHKQAARAEPTSPIQEIQTRIEALRGKEFKAKSAGGKDVEYSVSLGGYDVQKTNSLVYEMIAPLHGGVFHDGIQYGYTAELAFKNGKWEIRSLNLEFASLKIPDANDLFSSREDFFAWLKGYLDAPLEAPPKKPQP